MYRDGFNTKIHQSLLYLILNQVSQYHFEAQRSESFQDAMYNDLILNNDNK